MSAPEGTHSALMTPPQPSRIKQRMPDQSPFTTFLKHLPDLNPSTSSTYNSYSSFAFTVQSPTAPRFTSSQGASKSKGGDQEQDAGAFTNILALADLKATPVKADADQDGFRYRGGETPYGLRSPIPLFHESPRRPHPATCSPGPGSKLSAPATNELRERPSFGALLGSPNVLTSSFAALLDGHSRSSPGRLPPSMLSMGAPVGVGAAGGPSGVTFSPLFSPRKPPLRQRSSLGEVEVGGSDSSKKNGEEEEGEGREGGADAAPAGTEPAASGAGANELDSLRKATEEVARSGRKAMPPPLSPQAPLFSPETGSVGGPVDRVGGVGGMWGVPAHERRGAAGSGSGSDSEREEDDEEEGGAAGRGGYPSGRYGSSWRREAAESPRVVKRRPSAATNAASRSSRRLRDVRSLQEPPQQNGSSDDSQLPKEYVTDDEVEPTPLVHAMLPQSPMCVPLNLETFLPIAKLRSDDALGGNGLGGGSPTHRRGIIKPSPIDSPAVKAATNAAINAALEAAVGPASSSGGSGGTARGARGAAEGGRSSARAAAAAAAAAPLTRRMSSHSSAKAAPPSFAPAVPPLSDEALMARMLSQSNKKCNCKKSKCLKLYCDCFAGGGFCGPQCSCVGCSNRSDNLDVVKTARDQIASRNPNAFKEKIEADSSIGGQHRRGCNCKKSHCMKKYCECFSAGVPCGEHCKCEGCHNTQENFKRQPPGRGRRPQAATAAGAAPQPVSAAAAAMRAGSIPMMLIPAGPSGARGMAVPAAAAASGGNRGMPTDAAAALALGGALQFLFPLAQQQQQQQRGGVLAAGASNPPSTTPASDAVTPAAAEQAADAAPDASGRLTTPPPSLASAAAAASSALGAASPQMLQMFSMLQAQGAAAAAGAGAAPGSKGPGVVTSNGQVFLPVMWPFGGQNNGSKAGAPSMIPFNLPAEVQGDPAAALKLLQQFAAQHMQQGAFPPAGMPAQQQLQQPPAQVSGVPPSPISSLAASLAPPSLPLLPTTAAIAAGADPLHAQHASSAMEVSAPAESRNLQTGIPSLDSPILPNAEPAELARTPGAGANPTDAMHVGRSGFSDPPHQGVDGDGGVGVAGDGSSPPLHAPLRPALASGVVSGVSTGVSKESAAVSDMDLMLDPSSPSAGHGGGGSEAQGTPAEEAPPPTWLQLNAIGAGAAALGPAGQGQLQHAARREVDGWGGALQSNGAQQMASLEGGVDEGVREPLRERSGEDPLAGGLSTRKRAREPAGGGESQQGEAEGKLLDGRQLPQQAQHQRQPPPSPRPLSAMRKPQRTITSALQ